MAHRHVSDETVEDVTVKNLRHESHSAVNPKLPAVARDNPRALLPAML
jgi:hypothetical protein